MVANLSTDYHVPLVDPATIIQKSIDVVKRGLIAQLRDFREDLLVTAMDNVKKDVDSYQTELSEIESALSTLATQRPKRDREAEAFGDKAAATEKYAQELATWNTSRATLAESKIETKGRLFTAQTKWDILYQAQSGGKLEDVPDPQVVALKATETAVDKTFDKLQALVDSIDPFLAPLPVSTEGGSANFAFTLKNPKPITQMANGLNETINNPLLERISKPFDLNREDLMDSGYKAKVRSSFINYKAYTNTLAASMVGLIPTDPFPKYEMLVPWNLAWTVKFLLPSWAPTGGGQFGFPGFPRPPKVV